MRISDWSSDVCSSDLAGEPNVGDAHAAVDRLAHVVDGEGGDGDGGERLHLDASAPLQLAGGRDVDRRAFFVKGQLDLHGRSEEHTSELQSLMRISYAVFCLKKKI